MKIIDINVYLSYEENLVYMGTNKIEKDNREKIQTLQLKYNLFYTIYSISTQSYILFYNNDNDMK